MWPQPSVPLRTQRTLGFRGKLFSWMRLLNNDRQRGEFLFQPGMQDRVGHREHPYGVEDTGRGPKERHEFGGAPALVFVRLEHWMTFWLPRGPRLRDSLVRPRFVFIQLHNPGDFRLLV